MKFKHCYHFMELLVGISFIVSCASTKNSRTNLLVGSWQQRGQYKFHIISERALEDTKLFFFKDQTMRLMTYIEKDRVANQKSIEGLYDFSADTLRLFVDGCECLYCFEVDRIYLDILRKVSDNECRCPSIRGRWRWLGDN